MAKTNDPLLVGLSGSIGKEIVFKNYGHFTVVTKYPDMSRVIRTPLQKSKNQIFARAVKYAQSILHDPKKLQKYKSKLKPGERVYNAAIREYLNSNREISVDQPNTKDARRRRLINTKDARRIRPINTRDVRKENYVNTKDARTRSIKGAYLNKVFINTAIKWRMKHPFKKDAHSPPLHSLIILNFLWCDQPESISMDIDDLDS